jgi:putative FmdB family regulatory protein
MPVYEYHCEIHQITESVFPMGEATDSIKCPICETDIPRVFSVPGIQFKGGGFYKTDNR